MSQIRLTAIVTSYNRPDMLEKSLLALRLQPEGPDEIIVADDGSRPEVLDCLRAMAGDFPIRLAFVTQKDLGFRLSKARNNGARAATGDYLYFTDQDMVFSAAFFKELRASMRQREFACAYALRFDEGQSAGITGESIKTGDFLRAATGEQLAALAAQHRKDALYRVFYALKLRSRGPKMRGYGFGLWREDYLKVNGFDESFVGWGYEDDDFCRRLYASGLTGRNFSKREFAVHIHHPTNSAGRDTPNRAYYRKRIPEIKRGDFKCQWGIDTPAGDSEVTVVEVGARG